MVEVMECPVPCQFYATTESPFRNSEGAPQLSPLERNTEGPKSPPGINSPPSLGALRRQGAGGPISSPIETAAEIRLEIEARLDKVTFKLDDINDFSDVLRETDEELFQVFLLKYEQGRSDEDIAAELGYSGQR